jgi:dihydroxyacetone kinase-like predicted kinase
VVAVVTGDGIGRIFRSLGVHHLVVGGQSMNPSTADLVKAVESVGSDEVVILPNNKNIRPVAEQVDALSDKTVRVVATELHRRGLRRPAGLRPGAGAPRPTWPPWVRVGGPGRAGEVTRAVRDAVTDAGEVHEGDWIGSRATAWSPSPTTVVMHPPAAEPPARSDARAGDAH